MDAVQSAVSARGSSGWPRELTFLLERHPRPTWPDAHAPTAAFWLEVHDQLRRDTAGLDALADDYRRGKTSAHELAVIAPPRLRSLIASLHGHHQIEDFHYFPAFRRSEPRLTPGFDRLEREHIELAQAVEVAHSALAELCAAVAGPHTSASATLAAERYAAAGRRLCENLVQHLADEEALVVPVLIEHGSS